jgi:hypothetical protein
MNSSVNASFRNAFTKLPAEDQELAVKNFALWQGNPRHPSLHFKKVGKYWSVRCIEEVVEVHGFSPWRGNRFRAGAGPAAEAAAV